MPGKTKTKVNVTQMADSETECFAIVLHMCVLKLPDINDYWMTDTFLTTRFARKLLSRDRFKGILYMLHINDNAHYVKRDKCTKSFKPYANLTVDEGICPFRGRVSFRIYVKNKPNKYGMKLYILFDAVTGYVLNYDIYKAAASNVDNSIQGIFERL
ncbi:hypothetical protein PR048_021657 [Dryococelus australis]|uniref:PiggyBac transposable element-derived protein domain-containing protein n=1 Tax=Dryococelus australis TaxID=614101 RepID=A0ABQ9GYV5_9NEOP|nr:hypothetical protein PR048_021657 [Dryococelus australis]